MNRVGVLLVVLALLAVGTTASTHRTSTGQIDIHTWGDGSADEALGFCPDDVFFVTATLRLLHPSPVDQVMLTVDRPGPAPAGIANAASPLTSATVQLGGCDRQFNAIVTGLLVAKPTSYALTFE